VDLENTLTCDLRQQNSYFKRWIFKPNPLKTEVTVFHLNNRMANHKINVHFCEQKIKNSQHPRYLGIVLGRTLTYKEHLDRLSAKVKARQNIIANLAGSTCGADANTLRINALSLVYSTAK
jgi:hypothetical protein